jgi:hypothetical protein
MPKKNKQKTNHLSEDKKHPLPIYEEKDDIYSREKEVPLEDEDNSKETGSDDNDRGPGGDLDVPGAESDDSNEVIGAEDEENNYYSLGGDRHDDLETDNG